MPADASFARFGRRLTFGYAVLALVLVLAVIAVTSVFAIVLYVDSLEDAASSTLQRAEVLAAQYNAEGEALPDYAQQIVTDLARTRVQIFILDEDHKVLAGNSEIPPGPQRGVHLIGTVFGMHPSIARIPGGEIVVIPDLNALSTFFIHYLAFAIPAAIATIVLAWLAGRRITRRALAPLTSVTTSLHRIAAGDFTPQPVLEESADFRELTAAYNDVAYRLTLATAERERNELQMRQFIADAGHELRTPLTVVMGYLDMLQRGTIADPAAVERIIETMLSESRRMRGSIEKLILLARLERPDAPHVARIDAYDLAGRVATALEPLAGAGRIRVSGVAAPIDGDDGELYEAIKNVAENAVRYAPGSPVTIDVARDGTDVRIVVGDTGPGMSAHELEHAFDRFYRGDLRDGAGDPIEGSGLGLAIAKRAVERAGGTVTIESAPGEGTRVQIALPAAR